MGSPVKYTHHTKERQERWKRLQEGGVTDRLEVKVVLTSLSGASALWLEAALWREVGSS